MIAYLALLAIGQVYFSEQIQLPVIEESVDEIILLRVHGNTYGSVLFVRDGSVLATRLHTEDMIWNRTPAGFQLMWQDYSIADRIMNADRFTLLIFSESPDLNNDGPWWAMNRNMRDLKEP